FLRRFAQDRQKIAGEAHYEPCLDFEVDGRVKADKPAKDKPAARMTTNGPSGGLKAEMREGLELFQLLHHGKGDPRAVAQVRDTCNVHHLRQLADVEQLFFRLDIEF